MFGHHMSLSNDADTHFSRTVAKELCKIFHLTQNQDQDLHGLYHIQSSDKRSLKPALAKFSGMLRFLWPKVCVLALITVRPNPFGAHLLSFPVNFQKCSITPSRESSTQHSDSQDNHRLKGFQSEKVCHQSRARCPSSAGVLKEVRTARVQGEDLHWVRAGITLV